MRRQSNPITPQHACIPMQSFSGRFIFLHLSTIPRSDFPGSHGAKKHYRLFSFERARATKSLFFQRFLSWRMQTLQRGRIVWRLNSQISQDGTFVHYPFLYWTFLYLVYLLSLIKFFSVNTRYRNAISSRQNAIFCRVNKSSSSLSLSLACFCRRKHPKINRSRFVLVKTIELDL